MQHFLDNTSIPQPNYPIRSCCNTWVVRDHQDRRTRIDQVLQLTKDEIPRSGIKRPCRLIGENHSRASDKRPSDRYSLALPTRKLIGTRPCLPTKPHPLQRLEYFHPRSGRATEPRRKTHVLLRCQRGYQVEVLKNEPKPVTPQRRQPLLRRIHDTHAIKHDGASLHTQQPRSAQQHSRFP